MAAPEIVPLAFDDFDYQFARVLKFPYLVLYRERPEFVYVLGVLHSASDPLKWRRRARTS